MTARPETQIVAAPCAGSFGRVYLGMWRQTKVAIKLLAHPADVFIDGSGDPHGLEDDHDRRADALASACSVYLDLPCFCRSISNKN